MKYFSLMALLFLFLTERGEAQPYRIFKGDTINRTDAKGLKQGPWRRYYDNDQLFSETFFKNGKPVGKTVTWYKSGAPQSELVYSPDGKVARMISWWENGKVKATGKYVQQKKDSTWNYFNERDTLVTVENYKLGIPHGPWLVYYPSGIKSEEFSYVDGKKGGPFKRYFSTGQLKMDGTYKNDSFDGVVVHFHMNGKPALKGVYRNGLKQGEWLYMNDRGTRDSVEVYLNGVKKE